VRSYGGEGRTKRLGSADTYWAAEPDPDVLIESLEDKREQFWRFLEESAIVDGVYKLWRFYQGLFYDWEGGKIVMGGEDLDISQLGVNEFRARLQILLSYTQKEIDWDPQGADTSQATLDEAKRAAGLLDWVMDEPKYSMARALRRQKEHALIYRVGYVAAYWDETKGDEIGGDENTLDIYHSGDLCIENPTLADVVFDPTHARPEERKWALWRSRRLIWDVAETYFSKRDEILASAGRSSDEIYRFHGIERGLVQSDYDDDLVDKWYFVHLPTPALPAGRFTCFVGDTVLKDGGIPLGPGGSPLYKSLPIHTLFHSEMLGTSVIGHSPAVDLAPLQEALNILISTALTNARKFGQTMLWSKAAPNWKALEPGAGILLGEEVKVLDFLKSSPEIQHQIDNILARMDSVSNISAVSRGIQDKETSGVHAALLDMKTVQANGLFDQAALDAASSVGQSVLDIFSEKIEEGLEVPIVGAGDIVRYSKMSRAGLKKVSRVIVKPGNPALRTPSGRFQVAKMMAELGLITNEKELLSVFNGSPAQRVLDPIENQTKLAHEENETIKEGGQVVVSITDDHLSHMKIHVSDLVGSVEARMDDSLVMRVMPHVLQHMAMLSQNGVAQAFMVALKWAPPELMQVLSMLAGPMGGLQIGAPSGSPGGQRQIEGPGENPEEPPRAPPGQARPVAGAKQILGDAREHLRSETAQEAA